MKHRIATYKILFLSALIFIPLLAGCSKTAVKKAVENERISIINAEMIDFRRGGNHILNVQSVELLSFKANPIYALNRIFSEPSKKGADNSSINTLYDRFGNKTEIRSLEDDLTLKCIILKTSVAGIKQVIVFGKNGEVKRLPDEFSERALTADGSYIAAASGIFGLPKTPSTTLEILKPTENIQPDTAILTAAAAPDFVPVNEAQKGSVNTKFEEQDTVNLAPAPQTTPVRTQIAVKENVTEKIKIDSLWLNNAPPEKKTRNNDLTVEPTAKIDNTTDNNGGNDN